MFTKKHVLRWGKQQYEKANGEDILALKGRCMANLSSRLDPLIRFSQNLALYWHESQSYPLYTFTLSQFLLKRLFRISTIASLIKTTNAVWKRSKDESIYALTLRINVCTYRWSTYHSQLRRLQKTPSGNERWTGARRNDVEITFRSHNAVDIPGFLSTFRVPVHFDSK